MTAEVKEKSLIDEFLDTLAGKDPVEELTEDFEDEFVVHLNDPASAYVISTNTLTTGSTGATIAATGIYAGTITGGTSNGTGSLWSNNTTSTSIDTHSYDIVEEQKELKKSLTKIEKRLAILVPNEKLKEQYESLQSAYEQYLALEALLYDGEDNE
jgi:hypothetical protein